MTREIYAPPIPRVTFALFAYNQEEYIREAVESALSQDFSPLQIILSDDCSDDRTFNIMRDIVERYEGKHTILLNRNKCNLGLVRHIDKIVRLSEGDIIVTAAGDDISYNNKTSGLVKPMIDDSTIMGVHSGVDTIDSDGNKLGARKRKDKDVDDPLFVVENMYRVVAQSHAFRKEVFTSFGPMIDQLGDESVVLAFREAMLGKIVYMNESLVAYRIGQGVSSSITGAIDEVTIMRPTRYASWQYYSILQMIEDSRCLMDQHHHSREALQRKLGLFSALYDVNRYEWHWRGIFGHGFTHGAMSIYTAFIRRNSPSIIRKLYVDHIVRRGN